MDKPTKAPRKKGHVPKSWKNWERFVCRLFDGERRGADYGTSRKKEGKNDCKGTQGFSIETKVWDQPTVAAILKDCIKAEARRECPNDIPLAIMKKKGSHNGDALVCIRLETFINQVLPIIKEHNGRENETGAIDSGNIPRPTG